ncbi:MAG TPA: NAD(P)H-hydrate epimerase [Caldilineaceae bacterium]|nr:NAD(P)H-hydrate epimerase [Caldilineaceae bacterium]
MERAPLPALTTAQMREVDRLMVEEYRITLLQMMENAGRALALVAKRLLAGDLAERPIVVLAGRGNNGGGGLAAARHLLNWGAWVQVLCAYPPDGYTGIPAQQLATLQAMSAPLAWAEEGWELPPCDLVIDAIIGYGLRGEPQGKARDLVQLANSSVAPILSLDIPSGLDADEGRLYAPHIAAAATLALALPKRGLLVEPGRSACGDLFLADIGVPPELYARLDIETPPVFALDPILALDVVDGQAVVLGPMSQA